MIKKPKWLQDIKRELQQDKDLRLSAFKKEIPEKWHEKKSACCFSDSDTATVYIYEYIKTVKVF